MVSGFTDVGSDQLDSNMWLRQAEVVESPAAGGFVVAADCRFGECRLQIAGGRWEVGSGKWEMADG